MEGAIIVARALVFGFKLRDDLDLRFERGLICGTSAPHRQHQDHPGNEKGDHGANLLVDGALERLPATSSRVLEWTKAMVCEHGWMVAAHGCCALSARHGRGCAELVIAVVVVRREPVLRLAVGVRRRRHLHARQRVCRAPPLVVRRDPFRHLAVLLSLQRIICDTRVNDEHNKDVLTSVVISGKYRCCEQYVGYAASKAHMPGKAQRKILNHQYTAVGW